MTITLLQVKTQVKKLIEEYSRKGNTLPAQKTVDLMLRLPDAVDYINFDLANTAARLSKTHSVVQNPVDNGLNLDTSDIKLHTPGTDNIYAMTAAQSAYLEAQGNYDVYIEEDQSGIWVELDHMTPTTAPEGFTPLRWLATAPYPTGSVRIRFTGNYPYSYCNYKLYTYLWPTEAEVQQHRPKFRYLLPTDYMMIDKVMIAKATRQYMTMPAGYYDIDEAYFYINRYEIGQIDFKYFRKPTKLTITGVDATDDAQTVDVRSDAETILPYGVISVLLLYEEPAAAQDFNNMYEIRKSTLLNVGQNYTGNIINSYNLS